MCHLMLFGFVLKSCYFSINCNWIRIMNRDCVEKQKQIHVKTLYNSLVISTFGETIAFNLKTYSSMGVKNNLNAYQKSSSDSRKKGNLRLNLRKIAI